MAFSWTSITPLVTKAVTTHMNEIKTAVDTLADNLAISHYSWSNLPVSTSGKINKVQVQELQNSLTYIDGNNVCSVNNASYDSGVQSSQDTGQLSSQDVTADTNLNASVDGADYASMFSSRDAVVQSTQYVTADNPFNQVLNSSQDLSVDGSQNSGADGAQDNTVLLTNWSAAQNPQNSSG